MPRTVQPACPDRIRLRHLQPLCLALLARAPGSGYDVLVALRALPMFRDAPPDVPGVYRTLQAFEQDGLIRGRRQLSKKGPARREFSLTPSGRVCLAGWRRTLEGARGELDAVIALVQRGVKGAVLAKQERKTTKKRVQGSGFRRQATGARRSKRD